MTSSDENEMESIKTLPKIGKKKTGTKTENWYNKRKSRNWIAEENNVFAKVLVDTDYNFAVILEQRALKRAANVEIFEEIRKEFSSKLENEAFKLTNTTSLFANPSSRWIVISRVYRRGITILNESGVSFPIEPRMDRVSLSFKRSHVV